MRLRRARRTDGGDIVLRVIRTPSHGAVGEALIDLDTACKTLSDGPIWRGRTRYWYGRAAWKPVPYHTWGLRPGQWRRHYVDHGDRWYGLRYARLVARLLRAAHREGVPLMVVVG
jgi:hypothetical protein